MLVRRPSAADFGEVLALLEECDRSVYGATDWTAEALREEWDELDLERDAWLVELDGRLAGYLTFEDRRRGRLSVDGYVHPSARGHGVGLRLLELGEDRVREVERVVAAGERVWLESAHLAGDERAPLLFAQRGFRRVRSYIRMVVTHDGAPEPPVWPAALSVAPLDLEREGRDVHAALDDAFAGEWGYRPSSYEEWLETRFKGMDPALSLVVRDGDEIAAATVNGSKFWGDWGWIGYLGVRAAWRGRGVGRALLLESFGDFWHRGEPTVALAVDVENPTGALRLYEGVGMRPLWQADLWQKELR